MSKSIYLDHAAATPLDMQVLKDMLPYMADNYYNPSAIYLSGIKVKKDLNNARAQIATWLGARPFEIFFTAGATEANNLAIQGVMRQFPNGEVLVSAVEHDSVIAPAQLFDHKIIPVKEDGIIDTAKLKNLITPKTVLVSVMMVNNELGTVQPLKEISALVKEVRAKRLAGGSDMPIYLHTDAAQAANLFDLHAHRLGVDLMSINGGKIYGPKQSGALFVSAGVHLKPLILGGGQEGDLRSGTENVAGSIGLSKAVDMAQRNHTHEHKRLQPLRELLVSELQQINGAVVNGSKKHQSPHIVSVTFGGVDNERLMMQLDEAGIQVAVSSACSASSDEPSHVLKAIGLSDEQAQSTIRLSLGRSTVKDDIVVLVKKLKELIK